MDWEQSHSIHIENLKKLCRICGKLICGKVDSHGIVGNDHRCYSKYEFNDVIGELYGTELKLDIDGVHPPSICKSCARVFYRYRERKVQNKDFSTNVVPEMFSEHNENCKVCSHTVKSSKAGRPKKRKTQHHGIMHKSLASEKIKTNQELDKDAVHKTNSSSDTYPSCAHDTENVDMHCIYCIVKQFCNLIKMQTTDIKTCVFRYLLENCNNSDIAMLVHEVGKQESSQIKEDAQSFALMYRDLQTISTFDVSLWLKSRNEIVKSFVLGIGNCEEIDTLEQDKMISLASSVESIYKVSTQKLVSPFSFLQNVCLYCISGSKLATDMIGKTKPSGGYYTLLSWLSEQTTKEPECPPGDVMNVFDNEQVIGRKSGIKPKNKAKVSIITNKGVCQLDSNGSLQSEERLKPIQILKLKDMDLTETDTTKDQFKEIVGVVMDQNSEYYKSYEAVHYEQLHHFVNDALSIVMDEQYFQNGKLKDNVDKEVEEDSQEFVTMCVSCGVINSNRRQICVGCKEKDGIRKAKQNKQEAARSCDKLTDKHNESFLMIEFQLEQNGDIRASTSNDVEPHERYPHVIQNHAGKKEIILTDPVFCNPNSFEAVASVLRQIGLENGIKRYGGESRHWTCICCDGLPYLICTKLKEDAVICILDDCKKKFLSKKDLSKHVREEHPLCSECQYIHEFDWFYIRIGSGHYEMNLLRSFFELNWIPFLEKLCEEMGFVSEAAKLYAKNCKDLHKTWQLLLVFHFAALRELVLSYVRHCIHSEIVPSAKHFFTCTHDKYVNNANIRYLTDQVCRLSQGIINFRMAVRRNNAELLHSSKYMTKELFHSRNHPKYQQIELYDHLQYLLMPAEVKQLHDNFASITTSGNPSSGQDFDFILEEKNRQLKQWISKGTPTDAQWQKIARNNVLLENIKSNTYSQLGLQAGEKCLKDFDIEAAINAFRKVIRKTQYLSDHKSKHVSLSGEVLDHDLPSYLETATLKRMYFLKSRFLQEDLEDIPSMSNPIPITPAERQKIECVSNWTIKQIESEILRMIKLIQDPEMADYHTVYFHQKVKNKTKALHLSLYSELKNTLNVSHLQTPGSSPEGTQEENSQYDEAQLEDINIGCAEITEINLPSASEEQYVSTLLTDLM